MVPYTLNWKYVYFVNKSFGVPLLRAGFLILVLWNEFFSKGFVSIAIEEFEIKIAPKIWSGMSLVVVFQLLWVDCFFSCQRPIIRPKFSWKVCLLTDNVFNSGYQLRFVKCGILPLLLCHCGVLTQGNYLLLFLTSGNLTWHPSLKHEVKNIRTLYSSATKYSGDPKYCNSHVPQGQFLSDF